MELLIVIDRIAFIVLNVCKSILVALSLSDLAVRTSVVQQTARAWQNFMEKYRRGSRYRKSIGVSICRPSALLENTLTLSNQVVNARAVTSRKNICRIHRLLQLFQ